MAQITRRDWSDQEVSVVVESYFRMLRMQLNDEPFVKARENEWVRERTGRSKGSVEFKYQNISAALLQLGLPEFVRGYAPMRNLQAALLKTVRRRIEDESALEAMLLKKLAEPLEKEDQPTALFPADVPKFSVEPWERMERSPVKVDFAAIEQGHRAVGLAGERAVVAYEQRILQQNGKERLASWVEHVSETRGDGLGYDVLSFDMEGNEKFIEVKTTRWQRESPFMVTRNEVEFSKDEAEQYHLYRVFDFGRNRASFYTLDGPLTETCALAPFTFRARPRAAIDHC